VRSRLWSVLEDWFPNEREASIVLLWQERDVPGGQAMRTLGSPPVELIDVDGLLLSRRATS
jgi:CRISPR-associated protein Cas2